MSRAFLLARPFLLWHNIIMSKKISNKEKAQKILIALAKRYPESVTQLVYTNPWELLVATQLSAQCTDERVNMITPKFFQRWPNPGELTQATLQEIEDVIHSTGFYHNKAKNLLACAHQLINEFNGQVPKTMEELTRLAGVARKTANVVLFGAYGINAGIAVDTHVKRISYRLGLTVNQDPVKIEKDLMEIFPQEEWGNVNFRMVLFGRELCKAKKAQCQECEFLDFCPRLNPV